MRGYNLFVSINYNDGSRIVSKNSLKVNNANVNSGKYIVGSGIINKRRGSIIYTAKTMNEVKQVTENTGLSKNIPIKYKIAFIPKEL
ncbi:MAG: hypothetical protein LKE46_03135 [Clostridium sp.]|jgi:hypothetical protein|uniref:hypothetical protein n=1 Tax=Clostridium sp. TaxID=1506 RepID=UPI0025C550AB|nr:hypothetical protein [Clostridium sp.]MCH3963243.1 hypothetical protein [Clostridium sp.]MCI1717215.1 hypothetical protein [Clostridium sp.]MCI1801555.1 hypothetical protein [Clostridium sp.]MCI1815401.1 hypothetical protein [Clostridium sp.]MCI1872304.1 hypothetical protein [Clostridium sp.]